MDYKLLQLKNSLKTLFINSQGSNTATVQIWFKAGSAYETLENSGIAHFLEHMFFKGTKKRPNGKIAQETESFGGEINAFTSFDYTCYYINCPASNLIQSTDIVLDMVSDPQFLEEDIIPERNVVLEEYFRSEDNPGQYSFKQIQKNFFLPPYSRQILGNKKTISNFSKKDLIQFRKDHYNTSNALLVIGGDLGVIFPSKKLIDKIETFSLPKLKSLPRQAFKLKKGNATIHHAKDVQMCSLGFLIPSPSHESNEAPIDDLAFSCLTYGESSPLYQDLVVGKSLINSCSGSTMYLQSGATHYFSTSFPPENYERVLKELPKSINEIISSGLKEQELTKIRNQYIATKVYEKESIEYFAFSMGNSYASFGDINAEDKFIKSIETVDIDHINNTLKNIFSRDIKVSLQVPNQFECKNVKKDLDQFISDLKRPSEKKIVSKLPFKLLEKSQYDLPTNVFELAPGIKFIYRENKMAPTFILHAYLKGGLSIETPSTNGISQIITGLLTKGHKDKDYLPLKEDMALMAASFQSFSGKNAFGLTLHGQSKHFKDLSKDLIMSLRFPTFKKELFDLEIELLKRRVRKGLSEPRNQVFKQVSQVMFPDHYYSFDMLGSLEGLEQLTLENVKNHYNQIMSNSPILFTFCGSLPFDEVVKEMTKNLEGINKRKWTKTNIVKPSAYRPKNISLDFEREQNGVFLGFPIHNMTSKEHFALKIMTTYLSGQSSELFTRFRDELGLCYSVHPIHFRALDAGYWGIFIETSQEKTQTALDELKKLIKKIAQEGLSKTLFEKTKKIINGQEHLNIQTNEDYANVYSVPVLHSLQLDSHYLELETISKMKHEDFLKDIRQLFNKDLSVVTSSKFKS